MSSPNPMIASGGSRPAKRPHEPSAMNTRVNDMQSGNTTSSSTTDSSGESRKEMIAAKPKSREEAPTTISSHLKKNSNMNSGVQYTSSSHTSRSNGTDSSAESSSSAGPCPPKAGQGTLRPSSLPSGEEVLRPEQIRNQTSQPFYPGNSNVSAAASLLAHLTSHQQQQQHQYQNSQMAANVAVALLAPNLHSSHLTQQQSSQSNLFLQAAAALSRSQQPLLGHGLNSMTGSEGQNQPISSTAPMTTSHQHLFELQRQKEQGLQLLRQLQEQRQRNLMHEVIRSGRGMADYHEGQQQQQQQESISQPPSESQAKAFDQERSKEGMHESRWDTGQSQRISDSGEAANAVEQPASADNGSLKKSPGSLVLPCRARGMPIDHNFRTAYFVVPDNILHGDDLICSHRSCRQDGIKFSFCAYCKIPVAKRNFNKRHNHERETANEMKNAGDRTNTIVSIENRDKEGFEEDRVSSLSSSSNPNRSDDSSNRTRPGEFTDSENDKSISSSSGADEPRGAKRGRDDSNITNEQTRRVLFEDNPSAHFSSRKRSRSEEPTDNDMETGTDTKRNRKNSNLQGHFDQKTTQDGINISRNLRKKWLDQWRMLLYERPTANDNKGMSDWLLKVLSTSSYPQFMDDNSDANMSTSSQGNPEKSSSSSRQTSSRTEDTSAAAAALSSLSSAKKHKRRKSDPYHSSGLNQLEDNQESSSSSSEQTSSSAESDTSTRALPPCHLKKYEKRSSCPNEIKAQKHV